MASIEKLVELNKQGDLGTLLSRTFNGHLGWLHERKDAEFMIGFASKKLTPSVEEIRHAVTDHYSKLGYNVNMVINHSHHCVEGIVSVKTGPFCCVYIVATTHYPHIIGDRHDHVRVTTTLYV